LGIAQRLHPCIKTNSKR